MCDIVSGIIIKLQLQPGDKQSRGNVQNQRKKNGGASLKEMSNQIY